MAFLLHRWLAGGSLFCKASFLTDLKIINPYLSPKLFFLIGTWIPIQRLSFCDPCSQLHVGTGSLHVVCVLSPMPPHGGKDPPFVFQKRKWRGMENKMEKCLVPWFSPIVTAVFWKRDSLGVGSSEVRRYMNAQQCIDRWRLCSLGLRPYCFH